MPFGLKSWLSKKTGGGQSEPARTPPGGKRNAAEPYHCVSIRPGPLCCEAAKQFAGMRFLSASVPRLPLPNCQAAACHCRYSHFTDRRTGEDRRGLMHWNRGRQADIERRRGKQGRRTLDAIA